MLLVAACSEVAPLYQPTASTTLLLQENGAGKVTVGPFDSNKDTTANPNHLSIGSDQLVSPYNDSFADYVATALRVELGQAGCYNPQSPVVVSGTLLANNVDLSISFFGFNNEWTASMTVRFVVHRNSQIVFDKTVSKQHRWESVSIRSIAIPKAIQEYLAMVQLLVRDLVGDPNFIAATKMSVGVAPDSGIRAGPTG
jgi:hypothetical protein